MRQTSGALRGLFLALLPLATVAACGDDGTGPDEPFDMHDVEFASELGVDLSEMTHLGQQLYIQDLEAGDGGIQAQAGDSLYVHYTGWLPDGTKFDSSRDREELFPFVLGVTNLIQGWQLGLEGMEQGGIRRLVIPPALGYGATGAGGVIPPSSALVFDIELVSLVRQEP